MPELTEPPSPPRRRLRLSVRGLMVLIGALGLAMALGQFWLANLDADRATLSYQLRVLSDPGASVEARLGAIDGTIQARGRQARRALGLLAAALEDPDGRVRASAARQVGRLGTRVIADAGPAGVDTVRPAAMALLDLIGDPDDDASAAAIQAIGLVNSAGGPGPGPIPVDAISGRLRAVLEAGRPASAGGVDGRLAAIAALGGLEPIEGEGPPWFRIALGDPDPRVRRAAIQAAMPYGRYRAPEARSPAPGWAIRALDDPDPEVRVIAIWNCSDRIPNRPREGLEPAYSNPGVVGSALLSGMESAEGDERRYRLIHLAVNDPGAAAAFVPEVVEGLAGRLEESPWSWDSHLLILEHLGPASRPALPTLLETANRALDAEQWRYVARIARVIAAIDPDSEEARALVDPLIARWSEPAATAGSGPRRVLFPGDELEEAIIALGPAAWRRVEDIWRFRSDPVLGPSAARILFRIDPDFMADQAAGPE